MVVSLYSKVLFHIDSERMNYKGGVFIIYLKVFAENILCVIII